jgi:hypothetical protein
MSFYYEHIIFSLLFWISFTSRSIDDIMAYFATKTTLIVFYLANVWQEIVIHVFCTRPRRRSKSNARQQKIMAFHNDVTQLRSITGLFTVNYCLSLKRRIIERKDRNVHMYTAHDSWLYIDYNLIRVFSRLNDGG